MKKNQGITLIVLVIIIIVLLILAGVALSVVTGNEGVLGKAEKAADETIISSAKEQADLLLAEISADYYEKRFINKDADANVQTINQYMVEQIGTGKDTSNGEFKVTASGKMMMVFDVAGNKILEGNLNSSGDVAWKPAVVKETDAK